MLFFRFSFLQEVNLYVNRNKLNSLFVTVRNGDIKIQNLSSSLWIGKSNNSHLITVANGDEG